MELRAANISDINAIEEIDGTIETSQQLCIDDAGEWPRFSWNMEMRALPRRLILPNRLDDESRFMFRQIVSGADEGVALVADYGGNLMAMASGRFDPAQKLLRLIDVRVDYEYRRQGLASALLFQIAGLARQRELRGVHLACKTDNEAAIALMRKLGFDLRGVERRGSPDGRDGDRTAWLSWVLSL
jgi:ribosomal protein S18 acetylase RimI-like enzyme